jgi:chemotaxis protein CheX
MTPTETSATDLDSLREVTIDIVQQVFVTMLEIDVWPLENGHTPASRQAVNSAIYLAGGWRGAVLIEFGPNLAFAVAARLMGIPPPVSIDDDVRDTVGELANIITGNLKPLLPPETTVSMPSVAEGSDFTLKVIGAGESLRVNFGASEGPFSVVLVRAKGSEPIAVC